MRWALYFSQLALAAIFFPPVDCVAQNAKSLELILRSDGGKAAAFSVRLVNRSGHKLYVAKPSVDCEDGYNGWIQVHGTFKSGMPHGCALDRGGPWPSILDRIRGSIQIREAGWRPLNAGESLYLKPGEVGSEEDAKPGRYEFWATYTPPTILDRMRNFWQRRNWIFPNRNCHPII